MTYETKRHANGQGMTNAERQARHRERRDSERNRDARIADAARILHGELLLNAGQSLTIPPQGPLEDTATFLRRVALELEYERRSRNKKGGAKTPVTTTT